MVVAQERDREKPLLAGASVTRPRAMEMWLPARSCACPWWRGDVPEPRSWVSWSGAFVAVAWDGEQAGEWNLETWLVSCLGHLALRPVFTCSTSQGLIFLICGMGVIQPVCKGLYVKGICWSRCVWATVSVCWDAHVLCQAQPDLWICFWFLSSTSGSHLLQPV